MPAALLTMPDHCGTLAAARCLGDAGVEVHTASDRALASGAFSRRVRARLRAPGLDRPGELVAWLLEYGARHPGTVLYPTNDELAWLQALHASAFARRFRTYSPDVDVIERVLDKERLHDACREAGVDVPETRFPTTREDARRAARELGGPVLLKQRTQILSRTHSKGRVVEPSEDAADAFDAFVRANAHAPEVRARMPSASLPLVQAYHAEGVGQSLVVSGFVDRTGAHFVARAARKVLQRPRRLGIALCLEAQPLDAQLAARVRDLCARVGYHGVFQVELLCVGPRRLLIDFNPRYYHYMAFDVARGMPLPLLVQHAATGDEGALARTVADAQPDRGPRAFSSALDHWELIVAQTLAGRMPLGEAAHWRRWRASHRGALVDAIDDPRDRTPMTVALAAHVLHRARHPRAFVRHVLEA